MRKYDMMTDLYNQTCRELSNPEQWQAFLRSACRNYKLKFDEQLLVYAQRPEATAVLELDAWNKTFHRWVNRGATGIAVFDRNYPGKQRLKYFFDISDTHEGQNPRLVPLWEMQPEYEEAVIETLENTFGELGNKDSLADAIFCAAENAAEDNYSDYFSDLLLAREGSMLDGLPEESVEHSFKQLLTNSAAYMMMERCGIDSTYYLDSGDFTAIREFSSQNTLNAIGLAVSDIGEMALREIASTVLNVERDSLRTFAQSQQQDYSESTRNTTSPTERKEPNEQPELFHAGGLQPAEPASAAPAGATHGEIRPDAEEIPGGEQESIVPESADQLQAERAFGRDSGDRYPEDGADDQRNGESPGGDRSPESQRPDAMDGPDEQHPQRSGGSRSGRAGVQLVPDLEVEAGRRELPAFLDEKLIFGILKNPHDDLQIKKSEIISFFLSNNESYKQAALMKDAYPYRYTSLIVEGQEVGYVAEADGLVMWRGKYLTRSEESKFSWGVVAELNAQLIRDHEYGIAKDNRGQPEESSPQLSFFDAETLNYPVADPYSQLSFFKGFEISQQVIDEALCLGSNEPNSLERICAHFAKDYPLKENAAFLKEEYGVDGKGFYSGSHLVSVWFDDTGLRLAEGRTTQSLRSVLVPWEDAAKRVRELLDLGRFVPQAVLENATHNEIDDVAANLWYVVQDFSEEAHSAGYLPSIQEIYGNRGGFPANTEEIDILLQQQDKREQLKNEMVAFVEAFRKDPTLQRFRWSKAEKTLNQLEGLLRPQLTFPSQPDFAYEPQQFITTDEMDAVLTGGGNVQDSKFRIYGYFLEDHTQKERIDFLKHEYGTGGSSRSGHSENHDSKGIEYSRRGLSAPYEKVLLKWPQVEKRIGELMRQNHYMSPKELEHIPAYEKGQLARSVYYFFFGVEAGQPRPFPETDDHYEAIPKIQKMLEEPEQLANLIQMMEPVWENTPLLDRHHDVRERAIENIHAFRDGSYSLFGGKASTPKPVEILPAEKETEKIDSDAYQLDYRYLNDRLVVFNQARLTPDDLFVVVARLEPNGELIFLDAALPELVKEEIRLEVENHLEEYKAQAEAHVGEMLAQAMEAIGSSELEGMGEAESQLNIGQRLTFEGRQYEISSINESTTEVQLRDITFESEVGMPIFRVEKIPTVEGWLKAEVKPLQELASQALLKKTPARGTSFDAFPGVPTDQRHNYRITNQYLGEGSPRQKFTANIVAIQTLEELTKKGTLANSYAQELLARYVGWGSLPQAFDPENTGWASEYTQLKELLSPEEYESARATVLNAHYTSPVIIRGIYQALSNMGFTTGNILDPGCGVGNFQGMLPESMADSKVFGIEIDTTSGRIAQQLYQKNSIAIQGYETTDLPDSFFDVAIGNVPFGNYGVADKRYDKQKFLIHDYFFGKTLDKVRPGGIIAFITSKGTMDKQSPAVRKYIAQRAELLGAIRLPNNAFLNNAGTEVTSDILFLQKRDRIVDIEPSWVHLATDEKGIVLNQYFVEHPEMILGEMAMVSGPFGPESTCQPYEDADLGTLLEEAVQNIHADYTDLDRGDEEEDLSIPADPTVRNFSYAIHEGNLYYRENSRMVPVELSLTAENRVKGMIGLRDCVRDLIEFQTEDFSDADISTKQNELNRLYDAFTKKYGLVNSRANSAAFSEDSSYCLLCSLEILNENGELERKADMFTKRTIKPHTPVLHVDTASEALAVSIGERASVDLLYMQSLLDKPMEEMLENLQGVIFKIPQQGEPVWVAADEYLSGNVREKLAVAREYAAEFPEFTSNVEALEKAQPQDLTASEIEVRLGSVWVPPEMVRQFLFELLSTPNYVQWNTKVSYSEYTSEWNISNKNADRGNVKASNTYGSSRVNAYKIIEETLNLRDVRVFDYVEDGDGKRKPVLNKKETAIAQAKQDLIKTKFKDWIWENPERREKLVRLYNDKFNSTRPREYDGSHIQFVGMNPEIGLRPHQVNAVARCIYGGNTLLAHVVGAGKTFEMCAVAMETKRLGLCSKSLFVVPNHLTEQMASEFLQLYPSANILVATRKDFETKNRKKFCGRIATGEYDAVIIGHSQFEKIPLSAIRQSEMLKQEKEDIIQGISELKRNHGERFTIKQLEKTKKSIEARLEKLNDQSRKDDVVCFEELGVDRIFVDESHNFKNLFCATKMRNVAGIAQTEAQKSSDLYMKTRYMNELTGGRGVIFATGTPISNSMVELFTIQRYLQYDRLKFSGLLNFDAWASTFGETQTAIELSPEGTGYRAKTRFARFFNIPELMCMFKEVADIQTADMLDLPVPKANFHNISVKPSAFQKEMVASFSERADKVRSRMVEPHEDNMLLITNDGRKLALDQRLINPNLPDEEGSKVNVCVENVFTIWEKHKEKKLTQLVFSDLSTPKNDGNFSVYNDIRDKLVAKGVPLEEIRFIHNADTEVKKKELFAKVRCGEVRVLLGSTAKLGAGTNIQDKLIALHDCDVPWRPADLQQRSGRIIRQGNANPEVDIYRYVTEETFDSYSYQLLEGKQKFISQIMTSKSPVRSAEDLDDAALSYAEIKMLATGNPIFKEKMDLDMQVSKLKILKQSYLSEKYGLEDKLIKQYPMEIKGLEERVKALSEDVATAANNKAPEDGFLPMAIGETTCTAKADAGAAILEACKVKTKPEAEPLGSYRGFAMELAFEKSEFVVLLHGALTYRVELGQDVHGNLTRLDNAINGISARLNDTQLQLENTLQQVENAKAEVAKPFVYEAELTEKSTRLNEIDAQLHMDEKGGETLAVDFDNEVLEAPEKEKGENLQR